MKFKFPKKFLWGSATAAYQVEGGIENDWSQYMRDHAEFKAKNSDIEYKDQVGMVGRFDSDIWSKFSGQASKPENYIAGKASDHYNRYKEDLKIAAEQLHHNAYRFSIEWSRIEPKEGEFNQDAIDHYREKIKFMKSLGIEPLVTLLHFTQPVWIGDMGGWMNKKTIMYYERYCKKIVKEYSDLVTNWITINEPAVYTTASHIAGDFPPGKKLGLRGLTVVNNLIKAHKRVYKTIKKTNSDSQVGVAKQLTDIKVHRTAFPLAPLVWIYDWLFNIRFTNNVKDHVDFIGINYYMRIDLTFTKLLSGLYILVFKKFDQKVREVKHSTKEVIGISDMGWYLYPEGLYRVLKRYWKKYKKPIIITEHGLADAGDRIRKRYLRESFEYMHKAIEEGVDVRGYMHWSLLDNYEWDKGFWPRFGLIEVDFETQERRVRDSARWYADVAKNGGF